MHNVSAFTWYKFHSEKFSFKKMQISLSRAELPYMLFFKGLSKQVVSQMQATWNIYAWNKVLEKIFRTTLLRTFVAELMHFLTQTKYLMLRMPISPS